MDASNPNASDPKELIGKLICYRVPGTRRLEWRGRVVAALPKAVLVRSVEEGYQHDTEWVPLGRILRIEDEER